MGYTHYWYRTEKLDKEKFNKAAADCKKVTAWLKIPIQYECDNPESPVFNNDLIRFNGVEDDGHETFYIDQIFDGYRQERNGKLFHFCKTARKPYDTAVTACLIVLKHHFGDDIKISSDGNPENWQDALNAVQTCLEYGEIPIKE